MGWLITGAALLAMVVSLFLIPIGLPGLWIITAIVLGLVLTGSLSWTFGIVVVVLTLCAEGGELLVLRRFGKQYGGSRRAFWGALIGGMAGLFVGVPIPVIGPLVTAFIGTFVGAGLVTFLETRSVEHSTRVGFGLLLARTAAVALKVATAVAVIGTVALALFI